MSNSINNRYEFVYLFDATDCNPNGDPDAGNMPRVDLETNCGIVTDVCLKRKIRNYVDIVKENQAPYEIHVREKNFLSLNQARAHQAIEGEEISIRIPEEFLSEVQMHSKKLPSAVRLDKNESGGMALFLKLEGDLTKTEKDTVAALKKAKISEEAVGFVKTLFIDSKDEKAKAWMCKNFFDVRTFGAVMSVGKKTCGQLRGPVHLSFAKSIDPIFSQPHSLSRTAAVNVDDPKDKGLGARKDTVPYGLYRAHGFISACLAQQTGFNENDLNLLFDALINLFEHDHSATRTGMDSKKLVVFKHKTKLGNAKAHKLFELVKVAKKEVAKKEVAKKNDSDEVIRSFGQYDVQVDPDKSCPEGVEIIEML